LSIRIASPRALFDWLNERDAPYAVLRAADPPAVGSEPGAAGDDIDLLLGDEFVGAVAEKFHVGRFHSGVKCDLYGVLGHAGSAYLGYPHLPPILAERILAHRRLRRGGYFAPSPREELLALLYHIVYHKNLQSGIHWRDPAASSASPYRPMLEALLSELGESMPFTHERFHAYLVEHGFGIEHGPLIAYTQHDFRHGRKAFFHARLHDAFPGEMNLYVIRRIAVAMGREADLIRSLEAQFRIVQTKEVALRTRLRARSRMRGGKWRRGGLPCIAVVVFDETPVPATEAEKAVHPFVFNRNQFIKQDLREWFIATTGARARDNPIHSTDNEAEAIGHLPLFFSEREQAEILERVRSLRQARAGSSD